MSAFNSKHPCPQWNLENDLARSDTTYNCIRDNDDDGITFYSTLPEQIDKVMQHNHSYTVAQDTYRFLARPLLLSSICTLARLLESV